MRNLNTDPGYPAGIFYGKNKTEERMGAKRISKKTKRALQALTSVSP